MGAVLGMGISPFPGFAFPDAEMASRIKLLLANGSIDARLARIDAWPKAMQGEWGSDQGLSFASQHRAEFLKGARMLRSELDAFRPDVVVMFADDHYENFHADIIPPFALYIREQFTMSPFREGRGVGGGTNIWGRDPEEVLNIAGHRPFGNYLARELIDRGFDMPYCYEPLHLEGLSHSFYRAILYLDYDQQGWNYPILPMHVNAYGSHVASNATSTGATAEYAENHVPGPLPSRCFELGRAVAQIAKNSDLRIALLSSSGWSHAIFAEKNGFLYPDVETDQLRFEQLRDGEYAKFASLARLDIENAGEHKLLDWMPLFGAMTELDAGKPKWCDLVATYIMNSNKCSVVFDVR